MFTIYKITCLTNGKIYIGQTRKSIKWRLNQHWQSAKCNKDNTILHKAMRKYGIDKFSIEEIECTDTLASANEREIYWVSSYQSNLTKFPEGNGYNMTDGGEGTNGRKGKPLSDDHKLCLSEINKGKKYSEETKEKIRQVKLGTSHSDETRKRISESLKGKTPWNKGKKLKGVVE